MDELNMLIMKGISRGVSWENASQPNDNSRSFTSDKLENSLVKIPQVILDEALQQLPPSNETPYLTEDEEPGTTPLQALEINKTEPTFEDLVKNFLGASFRSPTEPRRSRPNTGKIATRHRTSSLFPSSKPSESRTLNVSGYGLKQQSYAGRPLKVLVSHEREESGSRIETYIPYPKNTEREQRSPSVQRSENDDSKLLRVDDAMLLNYLRDHSGSVYSKSSSPKNTTKPSARESTKSLDHTFLNKFTSGLQDSPKPASSRRKGGSDFLIKLRQKTPDLQEGPLGSSETPTTYRIESPAKQQITKRSPVATPPSFREEFYFQGQTEDSEDIMLSPRPDEFSVLRPKIVCNVDTTKFIEISTSPINRQAVPFSFSPTSRHFSASNERKKSNGKLFKGRSLKPVPVTKSRNLRSLRLSSV
mmetsp:Transcript_2130/g.5275  ORF Transcript_2130/g.5275 Transcript_2130/m.5275 type:complete len:418 (-) Transcript_2130:396-1649(-)